MNTAQNRFAPATKDNPTGYVTSEITLTGTRMQDDNGRLAVAFSSEAPVERWDWRTGETYLEILDHTAGAVDLSYAKDGLPFCLDHDLGRMVGLLEDVTIDEDRIGRGWFRKGNHPDAEWVSADMADGIRKKISFGYWPGNDYEQNKRADGVIERRYRNWMPYEASTVPVPADYDKAGVGRGANGRTDDPSNDTRTGATPNTQEQRMNENASVPGQAPAPDTRAAELAVLAREGGMTKVGS